jgi:hypothetical protein
VGGPGVVIRWIPRPSEERYQARSVPPRDAADIPQPDRHLTVGESDYWRPGSLHPRRLLLPPRVTDDSSRHRIPKWFSEASDNGRLIKEGRRVENSAPRVRLRTPWSGPRTGARDVCHAWTDGSYRQAAGLGWIVNKGEGTQVWVKGHQGTPSNEKADALAGKAAEKVEFSKAKSIAHLNFRISEKFRKCEGEVAQGPGSPWNGRDLTSPAEEVVLG